MVENKTVHTNKCIEKVKLFNIKQLTRNDNINPEIDHNIVGFKSIDF